MSSFTSNEDGTTMETTKRPTSLFDNNKKTTGNIGDTVAATLELHTPTALSTVGTPTTLMKPPSVAFLPEMPQWKKDLIQRRKSNVVRSADVSSPISPDLTAIVPTLLTSPSSSLFYSSQSPATKITTNANNSPRILLSTLNDQQHAVAEDVMANKEMLAVHQDPTDPMESLNNQKFNNKILIDNASKATTTTTLTKQSSTGQCATTTGQSTYLQNNPKNTWKRMPATNTNITMENKKINTASDSPIQTASFTFSTTTLTPTKEKSEYFIIGGHYTPQAAIATETIKAKDANEKVENIKIKEPASILCYSSKTFVEMQNDSPTITSTAGSCSVTPPIPKQRTSLSTNTTTNNARSQYTKEQQLQLQLHEEPETIQQPNEKSNVKNKREQECSTSSTKMSPFTSTQCGEQTDHYSRNENEVCIGNSSECAAAAIISKSSTQRQRTTTPTGALPLLIQSYAKCETENTSALASMVQQQQNALLQLDKNLKKISEKLQSNQFIKNQQQKSSSTTHPIFGLSISPKHSKYKLQDYCVELSALSPTKLTTQMPIPIDSKATITVTSFEAGINKKNKMVAVQEVKKTQNGSHHNPHGHHQMTPNIMKRQTSTTTNTATGAIAGGNLETVREDLSYGPGIVSKLRCHYLSLALRESIEQHDKPRLTRSTSLNTLLDRETDDELVDCVIEEDAAAAGVELRTTPKLQQQSLQTGTANFIVASSLQTSHVDKLSTASLATTGTPSNYFKKQTLTCYQLKYGGIANASSQKSVAGSILSTINNDNGSAEEKKTASTCIVSVDHSNGASLAPRSRHFKRGNEIMKRARSVEALLCDRSQWQYPTSSMTTQHSTTLNRSNYNAPVTTGTVTIEDKIHNARDRLHSGTDSARPKRLVSIIDDTERPPADLVKQTLKKFEASANRRSRVSSRANGTGDVASKVANYKSIIKENKLPFVFPKSSCTTGGSPGTTTPSGPVKKLSSSPRKKHLVDVSRIESSATACDSPILSHLHDNTSSVEDGSPLTTPHQNKTKHTQQSPIKKKNKFDVAGINVATATTETVANANSVTQQRYKNTYFVVGDGRRARAVTGAAGDVLNVNDQKSDDCDAQLQNDDFDNGGDKGGNIHEDGDNNDDEHDKYNKLKQQQHSDCVFEAPYGTLQAAGANSSDLGAAKHITKSAIENIAGAAVTKSQQFNSAEQSTTYTSTKSKLSYCSSEISNDTDSLSASYSASHSASSASSSTNQIGVISPLLGTANNQINNPQLFETVPTIKQKCNNHTNPPLTIREIEKNRINEIKKTNALAAEQSTLARFNSASDLVVVTTTSSSTSLDQVINTKPSSSLAMSSTSSPSVGSGYSELDANNSPVWAIRKRRQPSNAVAENTSMVFNFSKSTKEVPDYIESDIVIFRRKREIPKPNEPGFVMLGDLSVETSTDSDTDDFSMCPPSPCDVEFENAFIVIDGKSSIRQKSKDSECRVQFNDTLTSTFEYPSEASLTIGDSYADHYASTEDLMVENLMLEDTLGTSSSHKHHHHHVAVDEIIQLPTQNSSTNNKQQSTNSILGNLHLGSGSLGLYTPVKVSPIDNFFQLGVTRAPYTSATTTLNSNSIVPTDNGNGGSIIGVTDGRLNITNMEQGRSTVNNTSSAAEGISDFHDAGDREKLQYMKPTNDDLNFVYSDGTQKTDLLY